MSEPGAQTVIAANRGPVSFTMTGQELVLKRGGGGLVSALSGLSQSADGVPPRWICAALSDDDRRAARAAPSGRLDRAGHDVGELGVRMLDVPADVLDAAYNGIANSTLWFVHHMLYATPTDPQFDAAWRRQWAAYVAYNETFAEAISAEAGHGAKVAVQDYHLSLVPAMLRAQRPDLRIAHFSHTPWAPPEYFRMLPDDVARALLHGILGADHAGFLSPRWADAFARCCADLLGAEHAAEQRTVRADGRTTELGVHPLGVDGPALRKRSVERDVDSDYAELQRLIGNRQALLRVDRTELSKNILRGLAAYRELLTTRPEWRERVVNLVFAYPSRQDLRAYREYTAAVHRMAAEIVEEFGTAGWTPVVVETEVPFPRSLAAYRLADVLLVNPIRDGMNLVAKEVPVCSETGCGLVLSREAGAADDLSGDALLVNPYDISATAEALHQALAMSEEQRRERTERLVTAGTALPPQRWLADQLAALDMPAMT
jgi:trehalose 6-phosphate synthase